MYIKRHVEKVILEAAQSFPCVVVYGPRQVGKSTTVNMLFGDKMPIVTLDDVHYHPVPALPDYAQQGDDTQTAVYLYWHCGWRHRLYRLFL